MVAISVSFSKIYILVFAGEISIKGHGTRSRFIDRLVRNLVDALKSEGVPHRVERSWSRLFLHADSDQAAEVARRVFGIHAILPATVRPWADLEDLLDSGEELFTPEVQGRTFAVRVKRGSSRQKVPFQGPVAERALGSRLFERSRGVDLKNPEVEARIELHGSDAYFFSRRILGFGGFPIGTEGRAVALVSGGFDSIVAAWLMQRRGVRVDLVFCNLGGDRHRKMALEVMKILGDRWSYGSRPQVHLLDFQPIVEEIQTRCPQRLWQVVLKRSMLRAAARVTRMVRASAIITGDAVGQVSSQTLQNLSIVTAATDIPVLRPVLTAAKDEIVRRAREIGTFDLSAQIPEYCALAPKNPETHAKIGKVLDAESHLDIEMIPRVVQERAVCDLRALDLTRLEAPDVGVDVMPDNAAVIDLRSVAVFEAWHYPGALRLGYIDALASYGSFASGRPYVFYCEVGLKSAHLAELMRDKGFDAYHVQGGVKSLMKKLEQKDPMVQVLRAPALR